MSNARRITKLSPKEKAAAVSGGVLDFSMPETQLRQRLQDEPSTVDVDVVLDELAHQVAWWRLTHAAPGIKPGAVCEQAEQTIAVIDELLVRLEHLHPRITQALDESLYRSCSEYGVNVKDRIAPDLHRLAVGLQSTIRALESEPVCTGPKGDWSALKGSVAGILRQNSDPQINQADANALAAELIGMCGLQKVRNS